MSDFINNLTSISWWIGVVIVGILLNLVAIYLKSPIDQGLSLISTKYQTRSKAKKAEREIKIANLVGNKHEQILHASETNFTLLESVLERLSGIFLIIVGILLVVLGSLYGPAVTNSLGFKIFLTIIFIYGILMVILGNFKFTKALNDQQILKEAKDRESKAEGSN